MLQRKVLLGQLFQSNYDMLFWSLSPRAGRHKRSTSSLIFGIREDAQLRPLYVDSVAGIDKLLRSARWHGGTMLQRLALCPDVQYCRSHGCCDLFNDGRSTCGVRVSRFLNMTHLSQFGLASQERRRRGGAEFLTTKRTPFASPLSMTIGVGRNPRVNSVGARDNIAVPSLVMQLPAGRLHKCQTAYLSSAYICPILAVEYPRRRGRRSWIHV